MKYADKLKDPRWQKKRLKIMERDNFRCSHCHAEDQTLNVHHAFYDNGKAPWDYKDEYLITLCEDCHKNIQKLNKELCILTTNPSSVQICDSFKTMCKSILSIEPPNSDITFDVCGQILDKIMYHPELAQSLHQVFRNIEYIKDLNDTTDDAFKNRS